MMKLCYRRSSSTSPLLLCTCTISKGRRIVQRSKPNTSVKAAHLTSVRCQEQYQYHEKRRRGRVDCLISLAYLLLSNVLSSLSLSTSRRRQPQSITMVETIHLSHMPPELAVFVALYTDVENASFLKDQLLAGNADFEYAFIDASMVRTLKTVACIVL